MCASVGNASNQQQAKKPRMDGKEQYNKTSSGEATKDNAKTGAGTQSQNQGRGCSSAPSKVHQGKGGEKLMADAQKAFKSQYEPSRGDPEKVSLTDSEDEDSDFDGERERELPEIGRGETSTAAAGFDSYQVWTMHDTGSQAQLDKVLNPHCRVTIGKAISGKILQPEEDLTWVVSQRQEEENIKNTQESTVENLSQDDKIEELPTKSKQNTCALQRNEGERRASERLKKFTGVTTEEKNKRMAMKRNLEGLSKTELQEVIAAGIQAFSQMAASLLPQQRDEGPRRLTYHQDPGMEDGAEGSA